MKKYEFVPGDEIVIAPGRTLKRIRALVAIAAFGITPGTTGGYIESEANLAQVYGDAQVSGNAWVSGNALVYGNAQVSGNAQVYGNAWVFGDAQVSGNARVFGDADFLLTGPIGSRRAFLTVHADAKIGVRFTPGCFSGAEFELKQAIQKTHGDNEFARTYCAAIDFTLMVVKAKSEEKAAA